MTRQEIASRNRRLAVAARRYAAADLEYVEAPPIVKARYIRQHARALVAGDDAWTLVWIHRARRGWA